jgi:hypothetical protein
MQFGYTFLIYVKNITKPNHIFVALVHGATKVQVLTPQSARQIFRLYPEVTAFLGSFSFIGQVSYPVYEEEQLSITFQSTRHHNAASMTYRQLWNILCCARNPNRSVSFPVSSNILRMLYNYRHQLEHAIDFWSTTHTNVLRQLAERTTATTLSLKQIAKRKLLHMSTAPIGLPDLYTSQLPKELVKYMLTWEESTSSVYDLAED